jgi:flagellar hook-associated protein 3 FlgL
MTGVSSLAQALSQIGRIKEVQSQFNTLNFQLSTGKKTDVFSGLGSDILADKRSRASIGSLDTYNNNITIAQRRIDLTLNAVNEFREQAHALYSQLVGISKESKHQEGDVIYYDDPLTTTVESVPVGMTSGEPDAELFTIQNLAGDVYDIMYDLLNSQEGERYLLGGADTKTQPITDTGTLSTAITTQISSWKNGTITTDQLIADLKDRDAAATGNTDCINDTIVGFSAALTAGNAGDVFVRVDDKSEIKYTALANDQSFRDIMVAAAYLKSGNLGPVADVYAEPYTLGDPVLNDANGNPLNGAPGADLNESKDNFYAVINSLISSVHNALDGVDKVRFDLEAKKARLDQVQQQNTFEKTSLSNLVSDIEGVDINEVAVKITSLQTALEASYSVTARVLQLSLVNYLSR